MFKCPLCNEKFKMLSHLKIHVKHHHKYVYNVCPVCGNRYKFVVYHCYRKAENGDKEHLLWYYLLRETKGGRSTRSIEIYHTARNYAEKVLWYEEEE